MEIFWIILGIVLIVVTGIVAYVIGRCDGELNEIQKRCDAAHRNLRLEAKIISTIKNLQHQEKIAKLEKQKRRR